MSAPSSQGDVLVYGILNGDLIALSEGRAQQLRRIHAAIAEAATWGELRARISATDYEDFMAHFDEPPGSDEPFDGDKMGRSQIMIGLSGLSRRSEPSSSRRSAATAS